MKTPSVFECVLRALQQEQSDPGVCILAIDMDACAAALCVRGENGAYAVRDGVQLAREAQSPADLYEKDVARLTGEADESQLARAWRRYIQSEKTDDPAVGGVTCRQLEAAFAPAAQLYGELFSLADRLIGNDDAARILLFGRMAKCALAVYAARDHFSADPFLPDPLFIACAHPEGLAEAGSTLIQRETAFRNNAALILIDGGGAELSVPLEKETGFSRSFFCRSEDEIQMEAAGRRMSVKVPQSLFDDGGCGMVRAAFSGEVGSELLYLRSDSGRESCVTICGKK